MATDGGISRWDIKRLKREVSCGLRNEICKEFELGTEAEDFPGSNKG